MNFNDIKDIKDLQQMLPTDPQDAEGKMRIIQELVPGKQITLAHVIGGPRPIVYKKLGLNPDVDYGNSAIGILNMSPPESAVIASDISIKTGDVYLGFVSAEHLSLQDFFRRSTVQWMKSCGISVTTWVIPAARSPAGRKGAL